MKLDYRKRTSSKKVARLTKKIRIRKTVKGSEERPRLCVYRSGKHIYAQVVDDRTGNTLVAASSLKVKENQKGKDKAKLVGRELATQALAKQIKNVVFDRNGYIFHGRVKSLADGAREGGLNF